MLRDVRPQIRKQFTYNLTHILCVMTEGGEVFYQFLKGNINNLDLIDFLNHVIRLLKAKYINKTIVMVGDNAKMHKTSYFKGFFIYNSVKLLYTVANNPLHNPIEYLFRHLKTDLRKLHTSF